MKSLYPPIEPFATGFLPVSPVHTLYYEECGNPAGKPAVFLHGGPGAGLSPDYRRFFDPEAYRLILFDQRGAGKSTPHAELKDNTTWHLVEDIELLRKHLGIDRWVVFGGSWGSTLSLCYAETHPSRVKALIVRGIFLGRKQEVDWFTQSGTRFIYPDMWEKFARPIPPDERHDMVRAYHKRLTSADESVCLEAAQAWSRYEASTIKLIPDPKIIEHFGEPHNALSLARIECHYFHEGFFFETDNQVLSNIGKIRHIPGVIVHGRYDVCAAMGAAWDLHRAWPEAELNIVADAGHAVTEPGIVDALVRATDRLSEA
jgi:proline iminopeptidase